MSNGNLVQKQIIDKNGKATTVWVRPDQDMSGFSTPASVSAPPTLASSPRPISDDAGDSDETDEDVINDLHEHLSESDNRWKVNRDGELERSMGVYGTSLDGLESVEGVDITTKVKVGTSNEGGERFYYVVSEGFNGPMEEPHQAEGIDAPTMEQWEQEGWEWDNRNQRYRTTNRDAAMSVPARVVDFSNRANMETYEDFRDEITDDY